MWGRVLEFNVAVWLALSPFIFQETGGGMIGIQLLYAGTITLLSSLAFYPPLRLAYLGNLLVAVVMVVQGRFLGDSPPEPLYQNNIYVGFYLMLIALIPNWASYPPGPWRAQLQQKATGQKL